MIPFSTFSSFRHVHRSLCVFLLFVCGSPVLQAQTTILHQQQISGELSLKGSPYLIMGEAIVPKGETLTIAAGVKLLFKADDQDDDWKEVRNPDEGVLIVYGTLKAIGTTEQPITFTRQGFGGGWGGFVFVESGGNQMQYCNVSYADFSRDFWVKNNYSTEEIWASIACLNAQLSISNSVFSDLYYNAIQSINAEVKVDHSVFYQIRAHVATISYETGIKIRNSIFWGLDEMGVNEGEYEPVSYIDAINGVLRPLLKTDPNRAAYQLITSPGFIDDFNGNFRLRDDSPLRGAGLGGVDLGVRYALSNVNPLSSVIDKANDPDRRPSDDRGGAGGGSGAQKPVAVDMNMGAYYALLIGVQSYDDPGIKDLRFPLSDIYKLKQILSERYTFDASNIISLSNPTRSQILDKLNELDDKLKPEDNLLIFYAGHGRWSDRRDQGYWLPKDAKNKNTANWISNSDIRDNIRGIDAQHTLLISDACFSGGIFNGRDAAEPFEDIKQLYSRKSRRAITSGAKNEAVPDKSVFLQYFVQELTRNQQQFLDSQTLFSNIRPAVISNSKRVPMDGSIEDAGHEGGDFIFRLKP